MANIPLGSLMVMVLVRTIQVNISQIRVSPSTLWNAYVIGTQIHVCMQIAAFMLPTVPRLGSATCNLHVFCCLEYPTTYKLIVLYLVAMTPTNTFCGLMLLVNC